MFHYNKHSRLGIQHIENNCSINLVVSRFVAVFFFFLSFLLLLRFSCFCFPSLFYHLYRNWCYCCCCCCFCYHFPLSQYNNNAQPSMAGIWKEVDDMLKLHSFTLFYVAHKQIPYTHYTSTSQINLSIGK